MRFGLLFAAEYMRVYAASILFAHFFMGGWHAPFAGTIGCTTIHGEAYLAIPNHLDIAESMVHLHCCIRLGKNSSTQNKNRPDFRVWMENVATTRSTASCAINRLPSVLL